MIAVALCLAAASIFLVDQPATPAPEPAPAAPADEAPVAAPPADAPAWPPPSAPAAPPVDAPAWPPPPVPAAPNEGLLGNPRAPAAALPLAGATKGPLARSGRFGRGLNIDLLELGPLQVIGPGGVSSGVVGGIGLEIDLGARLALRLPLKVGGASASGTTDADGTVQSRSFVEVAFAPSVLYRFRDRPGQRWIPFVVAGLDAGIFQFGRQLVGLSPSPKGTAQEFVRAGAAPKGAVGLLYNPTRLFGLRLTAEYTYFFIANASVHTIAETIAARFSF